MTVPAWIQDAVFYQIFPDRFYSGDPRNHPANVRPWEALPTVHGFQGGDLAGIIRKLDYLSDLGINALYLNPIFLSPSTHRYDTTDYYRIDPKLGSLADFHHLVEAAHSRGIRLILDGVFNHCSRGFFAFNDLLENGPDSPYLDWFHVHRFPLHAYEPGKSRSYDAWWGIKSLPKFNTDNPAVRRYLLEVGRYWIEQGADGWRLDVPNEIDDDPFWAEFRQGVRAANPEAYLLGEIWEALPRWADAEHFDGLMNYPLRTALLGYLNGALQATHFGQQVEGLLRLYPRENVYAQYNLLGSHDTERIITLLGRDVNKVRLAMLFQFAYPGAPGIYYGDEVGLEGGRDPDCRRTFPWEAEQWQPGLREWVQKLIAARKSSAALRSGDYQPLLYADGHSVYVFMRTALTPDTSNPGERVLVALNAGLARARVEIPAGKLGLAEGHLLRSLLDDETTPVQAGCVRLTLEPVSGKYLRA